MPKKPTCLIIIPYRDQVDQLQLFVKHMRRFMKGPYKIIVIEQVDVGLFNRGKLLNIGYDLVKNTENAYFIFHDVNLLPDILVYEPPATPTYLAKYITSDGVFAFQNYDFEKVNGFSNNFWGCGGEDADMAKRILAKGMEITYADGRHVRTIPTLPAQDPTLAKHNLMLQESKYNYTLDGLSNLAYTLGDTNECDDYIKYQVHTMPHAPKMTVVIPFFNSLHLMEELIGSLQSQVGVDWEAIFIDDKSRDGGLDKLPEDPRFRKYRFNKRFGKLHNFLEILTGCEFDSDEVICILDGDDVLADEWSLYNTRKLFLDEQCLFTYGRFNHIGGSPGAHSPEMKWKNFNTGIRKNISDSLHMVCFRYKLFREFCLQDPTHSMLKDPLTNEYFDMGTDVAISAALLEIAGYYRSRWNPFIVYSKRIHDMNHPVEQRNAAIQRIRGITSTLMHAPDYKFI